MHPAARSARRGLSRDGALFARDTTITLARRGILARVRELTSRRHEVVEIGYRRFVSYRQKREKGKGRKMTALLSLPVDISTGADARESNKRTRLLARIRGKKEETKSAVIVCLASRLNGGGVPSSFDPPLSGPFWSPLYSPVVPPTRTRCCILRSERTQVRGPLRSIDRIFTHARSREEEECVESRAGESTFSTCSPCS